MLGRGQGYQSMFDSWAAGMAGQVPTRPGYYWVFVQWWRMARIDENMVVHWGIGAGVPVNQISPDRWGKEF